MATQAIVSIIDKEDKTIIKAICGCEGFNAQKLADTIKDIINKDKKILTIQEIYNQAMRLSFGCNYCLVVMNDKNIITEAELDELSPLYRETFNDPKFNPRWNNGTADHTILIKLEK